MAFTWDRRTARYRNESNGRFVGPAELHAEVVRVADASGARMADLARRLQAGQLTPAGFQAQAMAEIKTTNVAAALAAHGGRAEMAKADWLWVARNVKAEYGYLRAWVAELGAGGDLVLDLRIPSRAAMYGRHAVSTFVNMQARDAVNSGAAMEEHWVLSSADHCSGCPAQRDRGWVPLGQLPGIGSQACNGNCACAKEFRKVPVVAEAA